MGSLQTWPGVTSGDNGTCHQSWVQVRLKKKKKKLAPTEGSWSCYHTLRSHTVSERMVIIRGGRKLGETIIYLRNWNYSHSQALHHQTRGRCASNSIRDIWSGDTFHIESVTSKHGLLQKVLSASTLAHQKRKLILQDDQNKTPSSDFPPSPQVFLPVPPASWGTA